ICKDASDSHFAETGQCIPLAHNTLAHHTKGGATLTSQIRKRAGSQLQKR
ncbi:hypothetical protein EI94DRAFT_1633792, partial [Lactarius quietus]